MLRHMGVSSVTPAVARQLPGESTAAAIHPFVTRRRVADRVFRIALLLNGALTAFWIALALTGRTTIFFKDYSVSLEGVGRIAGGIAVVFVAWGFIWWGIKAALLKYFVGMSKEDRRRAFSSRMDPPGFDVVEYVTRYSERRIRIADMVGRRGRFTTIAMAGLGYMYYHLSVEPTPAFASAFLAENLFDAIATNWIFLAFYYANGVVAAAFYGPQSRIMDGVLARANCLMIFMLWSAFKFLMVPMGLWMSTVFTPDQFAVLFALIWCSYIACDGFAEIGGSLYGRQTLRVWGIGDVNRKSVGGTVTGFAASLILCTAVVLANDLPAPWLALGLVISLSNTALELFSPRGTDDFTMATSNALICCAFGVIVN
jgi:hypothetical protein